MNNWNIRSILEREKLYGPNFSDWYRNLRIVLKGEGKLVYLEQALPEAPAPDAAVAVRDVYTTLYKAQLEVAYLMLISMTPELQKYFEHYNAYDMIKELKIMFQQPAHVELFETVKAFHACKQEEWQSVSSYVLKMKGYLDQLERLGFPMPKEVGVCFILNSLSKGYEQFVHNYNMYSMRKTISELHAMLKLVEKGIPKKVAAPAVVAIMGSKIQKKNNKIKAQAAQGKNRGRGKGKPAYALKPKIPPTVKNEHPTKDSTCHHCHEMGHWRRTGRVEDQI
ncbi:hypothetical protein Tco_1217832 [Tanacetum coccineum]